MIQNLYDKFIAGDCFKVVDNSSDSFIKIVEIINKTTYRYEYPKTIDKTMWKTYLPFIDHFIEQRIGQTKILNRLIKYKEVIKMTKLEKLIYFNCL